MWSHAQKPYFVFRRNGRVHLNRRWRQFSRLLAAEVSASTEVMVIMLDIPCSEVVWRILATYSIRQFTLHFPSRALPCAITFQLDSTVTLGTRFETNLTLDSSHPWHVYSRLTRSGALFRSVVQYRRPHQHSGFDFWLLSPRLHVQ